MGLCCISTDCPCGGPREIIEEGANGCLIPVGDEAALAACLERLLADEALRTKLGHGARQRAEDFSPDIIFEKWQAFVEKVISE